MIPTLIFAGHMTCAEALGTILFQQFQAPGGWAEVADGTISARDLVKEGLRFDSPLAGMYRTAVDDVVVGDVSLSAGSRLLLLSKWPAGTASPPCARPRSGPGQRVRLAPCVRARHPFLPRSRIRPLGTGDRDTGPRHPDARSDPGARAAAEPSAGVSAPGADRTACAAAAVTRMPGR